MIAAFLFRHVFRGLVVQIDDGVHGTLSSPEWLARPPLFSPSRESPVCRARQMPAATTPGRPASDQAFEAWRQAGISQRRLARDLDVAESEVLRMLNPEHSTKATTIDRAMRRLGKRIIVTVGEAA